MVAAQKSNESALMEKRERVMLELDKIKRYCICIYPGNTVNYKIKLT